MAKFEPTASQKRAIETRDSSVLISAGAGSGKTKVLTERLIGFLTDPENPKDIDSFLIITYTRAAAGELKSRIMQELTKALEQDPSNRRLRRQSALCAKAQIGTIHSFCSNVIRQNCHELGLSPDFQIIDEERAKDMKKAALDKVLEEKYEKIESNDSFRMLVDTVGAGRNDAALEMLIMEFHGKLQSHARPEKWVEDQIRVLESNYTDISETMWGRELMDGCRTSVGYWAKEMDRLAEALSGDDALGKVLDNVSSSCSGIRKLEAALDTGWDNCCDCFPIPFPRWSAPRKYKNPEWLNRVKVKRDECKKAMDRLQEQFSAHSDSLLEELKLTSGSMVELMRLTMEFDHRYAQDKKRVAALDYSDLEHFAARLLTREDGTQTDLAKSIADRFTEIMVDEYQDVSRVQDTIFHAIANNNLFLVGDLKQSVYGFRLAEPKIFKEKYENYVPDEQASGNMPRRILLRENFRSRHEILEAANAVFRVCMSEELGDVAYDEKSELVFGASYYEGTVPVPEILIRSRDKDNEEENRSPNAVLEAEMIADRIQELMHTGCTVGPKDAQRPLGYGDIAILMRSLKNNAEMFRRVFAQRGIPIGFNGGGDFFGTLEISSVVSLLTVTDNPHQDIPLLAVLKSPAFGFTADELAEIKNSDKKAPDLYTALQTRSQADEKCAQTIRRLQEFRVLAPDMTPSRLVWYVINELDLMAVCSAMNDGTQRRDNLLKLVEMAKKYEATGYKGLHRFVLWIDNLASEGKGAATCSAVNAVQLMSVHKSKGLEFPIVFLANTAKRFNNTDLTKTVLVHPELGLGPSVSDMKRKISYPTFAKRAIAQRIRKEMRSEEMRMLYVAMTRPKERLFITAVMDDLDEKLGKNAAQIGKTIDPEVLMNASDYITWVLYAWMKDSDRCITMARCGNTIGNVTETVQQTQIQADGEMLEEVRRRLSFRYSHTDAQKLPSKVTATELKATYVPDEDTKSVLPEHGMHFRLPDFGKSEKPATGTERGIATHLVLQHMNFLRTENLEQVRGEIARLRDMHFITERQAECVDETAILKLFVSDIGKRIKEAGDRVMREFKFSLLVDARELYGTQETEELLLQGVVDCCIEEDGELVIIDYKTDRVRTAEEIQERTRFYAGQIRTYAQAMERICGKKVKQCVLYYLRAGKEITIIM